jgi:Flp pilus assembly pilin Flp
MLWKKVLSWLRREEGQDLTEYALLLILIVVAAVAAAGFLGDEINAGLDAAVEALQGSVLDGAVEALQGIVPGGCAMNQ